MRKRTKLKLTPLTFGETNQGDAAEPALTAQSSDGQSLESGDEATEALFVPARTEPVESRPNNGAVQFIDSAGAGPSEPRMIEPPVAVAELKPVKMKTPKAPKEAKSLKNSKTPKPGKTLSPMPDWARYAYWVAVPAAVLWGGCMAAFASGYQNPFGPFEYRPFPMIAFAGLCLLPAVFILLAAYAVRQAAKLSMETRRARALADDMAIPAALAADQVGGAAEAVRHQVDRAAAAAAAAEQQLLGLRRALSDESDRLIEATGEAERRAQALTQGLAREREEMDGLSRSLDAQVQAVADAITAQSRMVAEASDLAATQIQEAEAALAARATDLATAAGEAGEAAELVGQVLAEHTGRLEVAGVVISERVASVQDALTNERSRLSTLADSLRADQEHIAAQIDAQRQQLIAASAEARASAEDMSDVSTQSAESLRDLIANVAEQVGKLAVMAEADQIAISVKAQENLKLFTGVVAEERAALEVETRAAIEALAAAAADTRKAAIEQSAAAREQVEQLGEAAFAAGQKADQAFDARISSARRMIEQSAGLVEEAGQRSAERIEAGLATTHATLEDLQKLLGDIDAKVAAMPDHARERAEAVRHAVEQGIGELTAAARRAAEETQAIDAAFQGRIKHNYEVLSEALRLMGRVAGAAEATAKVPLPTAPRPARAAPEAAHNATVPETEHSIRVPKETYFAAQTPPRSDTAAPESLGLRPRLRLSVDAPTPAAPRRAAPISSGPTPPRHDAGGHGDTGEWTWKDLLSSIDEPPIDDEVLAERLISEIEALGLDVGALLPNGRIDEIAAVMQSGDADGVREVVRNLAPSAVRRLSRRVLTDKVLRAHADRYLQRYEDLLSDSAKRDRDGFVTATLLGSDPGRAFLLFNAAVGELH
jgi:hypothetical protein